MCLHLVSLFTDPLFSIQSPSRARDKKINHRGFIHRTGTKGYGWGKLSLALAQANVFQKNKKKNETTSVYRLTLSTFTHTPGFYLGYLRGKSSPPPKKENAQLPSTPQKTIFLSYHHIQYVTIWEKIQTRPGQCTHHNISQICSSSQAQRIFL